MQFRPKAGPGPRGPHKSVEATGAKKIADSEFCSPPTISSDTMANKPAASGAAAKPNKSGGKNLQTAGKVDKVSSLEMAENYLREVEDTLAKITAMANLQGEMAADIGRVECVEGCKSEELGPRKEAQEETVERDQAVYEEHPAVRVVSHAVSISEDTVLACAGAFGYDPSRARDPRKGWPSWTLTGHPRRRIRRFCRRLFGKMGAWRHVTHQAQNPYENEGSSAFRSSKKRDVEAWLDGTVEPLLKNARVTGDQLSEGQFWDGELEEERSVGLLCQECQKDASGSSGRAECANCYCYWKTVRGEFIAHGDTERLRTIFDPSGEIEPRWDPARPESFLASTGDSIQALEGNGRGKWGRIWRRLDMEVVARLGRWSRKARMAAKCGTLTTTPSYHMYDENWECDYSPMLFFIAAENSDVQDFSSDTVSEILRDLADSFGVPGSSGPEADTDDDESVETVPDFSKIKVILPSGEIGYPGDAGKFGAFSCRLFDGDSASNGWESVDASDTEYGPVAFELAPTNKEIGGTLKAEAHAEFRTNTEEITEEATEEIYTYQLATDSFSRHRSVDTQLSEIFRQYRDGEFEENNSPLAAAEKFTRLVNEVFRAACDEANDSIGPERECSFDTTTQALLTEDAATRRVPLIGWAVETEERQEKEGRQCIVFENGKEELGMPFLSSAVAKCARDFMRELKLVTKAVRPKGEAYEGKDEANEVVVPEDASEGIFAMKDEAKISADIAQTETIEAASAIKETKTAETASPEQTSTNTSDHSNGNLQEMSKPAASESASKVEPKTELVVPPPEMTKGDQEVPTIAIPVPWWSSLVNPPNENPVATLWQSLALDESDGWQRIRVDFLRGEDLQLVSETRERVAFLRKMKKVIIEKANVEYAAPGFSSDNQTKLKFAEVLEVFSPTAVTQSSTKKGILKQPLSDSSDSLIPKRFKQALNGDQVKNMEEEMRRKCAACTEFIISLRGKFELKDLESSLELLRDCFSFSMQNYLVVAREQFLDYTHYMSGVRNRIRSGLDLLYAAGEMLAMLVDFLCDAETTETSIIEVEQRTEKLMRYLANSGTALEQVQNSLDILRTEDFDYVKTMVEFKLTGFSGVRDLSDTYKMFLKFHVEDAADTKVVDKISGYDAFQKASDALEQATAYHSVSFFAIRLSRLQRGLDIVKDTRAALESYTTKITRRLRKVKRGMAKKAELDMEVKKSNGERANTQDS